MDVAESNGAAQTAKKESVSVGVRIRPMNSREKKDFTEAVWTPVPETSNEIQRKDERGKPVRYAFGRSSGVCSYNAW